MIGCGFSVFEIEMETIRDVQSARVKTKEL